MKILKLTTPSFVLLVRQLRKHFDEADAFEFDLDLMRVKGDLAVIRMQFQKPLIARTTHLDLAKRAVKAGLYMVKIPADLEVDMDFQTMVKNKKVLIVTSNN